MYCSNCGTPVASELSFCNRCGTVLNKDRTGTRESGAVGALITAVVLVAIFGLGIMCGGSIALKKGGEFSADLVGLFMIFSFTLVGFVEVFLVRQLSRVLASGNKQELASQPPQPLFQPAVVPASEVRAAHLRTLPEPISSVTENTTRTLEQSFRPSLK